MERPKTRMNSSMGRPGSSMRVGSRAGMPPPSSMGRMGGGLHAGANAMKGVAERPVTKQGVANPTKIRTGYSNRSVKDAGYWKYTINTKTNEIEAKINEYQQKTERIYRDLDQFGPMVEKAEKTAKELAEWQTQFRSINLTKDLKQRGELNDAAIASDVEAIKEESSRKKREIEDLMKRKDKVERKTKEIQSKIDGEERAREETLRDALPPDEYKRVMEKQKELKKLTESVPALEEKLVNANQLMETRQKRLKMETPEKFYAYSLLLRIRELVKEKQRLEEKNNKFDQEAEQTRLMEDIQTKKQRIEEMRGRLNFLNSENKNLDERLMSYENDAHLKPDQMERLTKLNAKQGEMKAFRENFAQFKKEEIERIQKFQDMNESILQQIASKTELIRNLPSKEKFSEVQSTLTFKQSEMEKAETTHSAVEAQKNKLIADLQKMNVLAPRITSEIEELKAQHEKLSEELRLFADISGLKERESELKIALTSEKESLEQKMDWVKRDLAHLESQRDELRSRLNANETYSQLKALEQKWVAEEQRNQALTDFIREKESRTDFAAAKAESLNSLREINQLLIAHLKTGH